MEQLRKMTLVLGVVAVALLSSCSDSANKAEAYIVTHDLALNFITPTGENLLDATHLVESRNVDNGLYCGDILNIICTRNSDGRTADYITKGNPTLPYENFRISYPRFMLVSDMSHSNPPAEGDYPGVLSYVSWKIGTTIHVLIDDFDSNIGQKSYDECYDLTMVSQAIYGDSQIHNLRVYCKVRNGKPSVYRIEYDGNNDNLLDKDSFKRVAQQLGYHKAYSNGSIFVPIVVERH